MTVKQQLNDKCYAVTSNYEEVLPYLDKDDYDVYNTYHRNGLFDKYFISVKPF